jgi:hypothetical protein
MSLHAVTTTASARRNLPGWTSKKVLVDHAHVGGVRTVQPRIQRYDRCGAKTAVGAIESEPPRDVGTVLSSQVGTTDSSDSPGG